MFEMAAGEVLTLGQDHVIAYVAFFGSARKKVDVGNGNCARRVRVVFDYQILRYQLKSTGTI